MPPRQAVFTAFPTPSNNGEVMGILGAHSSSEFDYGDDDVHSECPACSAPTHGSEYCSKCEPLLYGPIVFNVSSVTDFPQVCRSSS